MSQTLRLLGLPDDARVVILHADDVSGRGVLEDISPARAATLLGAGRVRQ